MKLGYLSNSARHRRSHAVQQEDCMMSIVIFAEAQICSVCDTD